MAPSLPFVDLSGGGDTEVFSALELEFFRRGDDLPVVPPGNESFEDLDLQAETTLTRMKTGLA
jgi:hypothetical protein